MSTTAEKYEATRSEIREIRSRIEELQGDDDVNVIGDSPGKKSTLPLLKTRRVLRGHFGKVYHAAWSPNSSKLLSASQDGKLILWDAKTTNKHQVIALRSAWVMAVGVSSGSRLGASGGLDNVVSIHGLSDQPTAEVNSTPKAELIGHEGYVSCVRFVDGSSRILSASGDSTVKLWDTQTEKMLTSYGDHTADVMCVAPQDVNASPALFATASVDSTVRVFDARLSSGREGSRAVARFVGHESDVNAVSWMPESDSLGSCSDDSTCSLFDMRSRRRIAQFIDERLLCGVTSVDFTRSGKFLVAGYDDYEARIWDVSTTGLVQSLRGHEDRISQVAVSYDGGAIATASWDFQIRIWA
ncbi:MAG: hypothetical protein MHM6MM_000513 [Cercozoa sp. M6MM]